MRAYHFLREDMKSGEGNEPPWSKGETRIWDGECELCESGYHSSPTWLDALWYAPGPIACIVKVSKPIDRDSTKQVSQSRTLIDYRDATQPLRWFACECAERALRAMMVDEQSMNDDGMDTFEAKRKWLKNTISRIDASSPRDARHTNIVRSLGLAVGSAIDATSAAHSAAQFASSSAAVAVGQIAALYALSAKAWDVAWDAAWETEHQWQCKYLDEMMAELFKEEK